ncbi:GNAT family N-acetyltransferase [Jannaschia sp. CCS1]|uniref:GNAT family N-acetyltransferase n=1 Tax=Jannaschia sp. (strain CCS1) TaxID=290400 RepID=UPI000053C014|nr:GNAT family N-acetyltransferase [Jannaschia sp. CCS1]ABD54037.1 acetyltransferase putative [Jannaschia sp. CCS1]
MSDARPLPDGFELIPLRSATLHLRPMVAQDLAALTIAGSDPGIWAGHPSTDRYKPDVFRPYFEALLKAGGTLIAEDANGQAIGMSRYYASADAPDGIGIGFTFLVRAHWGGQTNFAMKRLMLDHLFATAPEAWFHIAPTNIRSQKATAKLGAARMDNLTLDLGTGRMDWVRMRLTRAAWHDQSNP